MSPMGINKDVDIHIKINLPIYFFCLLTVYIFSLLYAADVDAAKWTMDPSITVGEVYTDNVTLTTSSAEQEEYITEVSPGISIRGDGAGLKLNFDYNLQTLSYAKDSDRNDVHHNLRAQAKSEIIEDHFYIDAESTVSQQVVDPSSSVGLDNFNTGNRSDVYTLKISPQFRQRLGNLANAVFQYNYNGTQYESAGAAADSDSNSAKIDLSNGKAFSRLAWKLNYSNEDISRDGTDDIEHETTFAEVRYGMTDSISLLVQGGDEEHDIQVSSGSTDAFQNGAYSAAGLGWHPNDSISLDAVYGNKFKSVSMLWAPTARTSLKVDWRDRGVGLNLGKSFSGEFSLDVKRTTWKASYTEDVTSIQETQSTNFIDAFTGELVFDPEPGQFVLELPFDIFALTDEIFIRKRGQVSVGYKTAKSTLLFSAFNEKRLFQVALDEETVVGGNASWSWKFAPRSTLLLATRAEKRDFRSSTREDGVWSMDASWNRQLSRKTNASLGYRHAERLSNDNSQEYKENRVTFKVNVHF